jgi:hypothetical protein
MASRSRSADATRRLPAHWNDAGADWWLLQSLGPGDNRSLGRADAARRRLRRGAGSRPRARSTLDRSCSDPPTGTSPTLADRSSDSRGSLDHPTVQGAQASPPAARRPRVPQRGPGIPRCGKPGPAGPAGGATAAGCPPERSRRPGRQPRSLLDDWATRSHSDGAECGVNHFVAVRQRSVNLA